MYSLHDRNHRFAGWVRWERAFELLTSRDVKPLWSGQQIRYFQLTSWRSVEMFETSGSAARHTRWSHNHEVPEFYIGLDGRERPVNELDANPEKVWTLKRVPKSLRSIYTTVVDENVADAA